VRCVFYWVGLTVTQPFNTGVQRVTRRLAAALGRRGVEVVPVKWDAAARRVAPISDAEAEALARFDGPPTRPGRPPLPERLAGEWLLLPEIALGDSAPEGGPLGFARRLGMRTAAVFYDLIPEKMPENYPAVALEALHAYWSDFASADLALPISWSVSADLARWLSARSLHLPAILPCPLAGDVGGPRATEPPAAPAGDEALRLLAVGTWEPRKNYPRLLRALLAAQRRSARRIELVLIGRRAGFAELDAEIERLAAETGTELLDHAEEAELHRRQRRAHATVFASWEEGFGLPVLESLWHGRPCLCHHGSAMAEVAPGGGTLPVDMEDEAVIAAALLHLGGGPLLLFLLRRRVGGAPHPLLGRLRRRRAARAVPRRRRARLALAGRDARARDQRAPAAAVLRHHHLQPRALAHAQLAAAARSDAALA
jgi:glycosyltransferase involved in cell wall biosynthesis